MLLLYVRVVFQDQLNPVTPITSYNADSISSHFDKLSHKGTGSYESSRQVPVIGDLRHRNLKVLKIAKTKVLKQRQKIKNYLPKLSLISVFFDLSLSEGRPHRISDDSANQRRP